METGSDVINPAAVEQQRRKAIVDARAREGNLVESHRANVPKEEIPRSPMIMPARVSLAEFARRSWIVNAEITHTPDDLLSPDYWAHIAFNFQPYDRVEVRSEDGEWLAELIVRECDKTWAKMARLNVFSLRDKDVAVASIINKYDVKWHSPQRKYAVIRRADNAVIKDMFMSKQDGLKFLADYTEPVVTAVS